MLIHGTHDNIVPWAHSKRLHELLKQPHEPYWVEGAGHNDVVERREFLWEQYDERCRKEGIDEMNARQASVKQRKYQSDVFSAIQALTPIPRTTPNLVQTGRRTAGKRAAVL